MEVTDELGPELALAFTSIAAVGASMARHFRIEDAKTFTRVCRRILSCAATPPPPETTHPCARICIDAVTTAITLLTRRLSPLDDTNTTYLSTAQAAMTSLRLNPDSGTAVVRQSTRSHRTGLKKDARLAQIKMHEDA